MNAIWLLLLLIGYLLYDHIQLLLKKINDLNHCDFSISNCTFPLDYSQDCFNLPNRHYILDKCFDQYFKGNDNKLRFGLNRNNCTITNTKSNLTLSYCKCLSEIPNWMNYLLILVLLVMFLTTSIYLR